MLRNATIKNANDNGAHKAFCEICLKNNNTRVTVSYCNSCLEHLCDICVKHHEKQEENRDHELVTFSQRDDPVAQQEAAMKEEWKRRSRSQDKINRQNSQNDNAARAKIGTGNLNGKLALPNNVTVAQTVTAADAVSQKIVVKLGTFNGKAPSDSATSDFRAVTFLTNSKVVFCDHANKKLKVYDISHKTRVELIASLALRADPNHMCRVDDNTVAVTTERCNIYHIRLFTVRDKIMHFVHKTVDGIPLGVGYLNNTIICSFLEDVALHMYRMTRAQQLEVGTIKQDRCGGDIFHRPGAICSGIWNGLPVIYVADETENGVTVCALDSCGHRKAFVFFETPVPKAKLTKRSNAKSKQNNKTNTIRTTKQLNAATTSKSDTVSSQKACARTTTKATNQPERKSQERVSASGHNTFRRVDDYCRGGAERKAGREIERTPLPMAMRPELSADLRKVTQEAFDLSGTIGSVIRSAGSRKPATSDMKAVERVRRPVGKVLPQTAVQTNLTAEKNSNSERAPSSVNPASTMTSDSTFGTTAFCSPPTVVYRADSLDVDQRGNIYVCMSGTNKVLQISADGKIKRELLTDKDGVVAPKVICFSPKNDFFLVTSLKNNKVFLYRLKQ